MTSEAAREAADFLKHSLAARPRSRDDPAWGSLGPDWADGFRAAILALRDFANRGGARAGHRNRPPVPPEARSSGDRGVYPPPLPD